MHVVTTVFDRFHGATARLPSLPTTPLAGQLRKATGDAFDKRPMAASTLGAFDATNRILPFDFAMCAIGIAASREDAEALNLCSAKTTGARAQSFAERARKLSSIAAGAISGCGTLPGRPIPGDEAEFYHAKEAAAIECSIVDAALTAVGIASISAGAGGTVVTGGVGAVAGVPAMAVGTVVAGAGAAMATRHAVAAKDARANQPLEWRRVEAKRFPNDIRNPEAPTSSGWYRSEREARALVRPKLGRDAVQVEPGKLRSRDGVWQYRAKSDDVRDNHIHLERLDPVSGLVLSNLHLRW